MIASPALGTDAQQAPAAPAQKPAAPIDPRFAHFAAAVEAHVQLHRRIRNELPVPVPDSEPAVIDSTVGALARAIIRANPKRRPGEFFDAAAQAAIRLRMRELLKDAQMRAVIAAIDDEPPTIRAPRIYLPFPGSAQMATMPPTILQALPPLPRELEYRIVGQYLVLRDAEAALIVDFVASAVPRGK